MINKDKLEVMVIDDELPWLKTTKRILEYKGYEQIGFSNVTSAKDNLKSRFSKQESFPDIYLCDMLDMGDTTTVIKLGDNMGNLTLPEITMPYQLLKFLKSLGRIPKHFIAMTSNFSKDDEFVGNKLGIYVYGKTDYEKERACYISMFPDVTNLSLNEAKKKFSENYNKIVHAREGEK